MPGDVIDEKDVIKYMTDAGLYCGIGASRTYGFGRFTAVAADAKGKYPSRLSSPMQPQPSNHIRAGRHGVQVPHHLPAPMHFVTHRGPYQSMPAHATLFSPALHLAFPEPT
jgi:hypothetical protein